MSAVVFFIRSQAFLEVVRWFGDFWPVSYLHIKQCEISALASHEKELHMSKARDSNSHLDRVSGILKDRTKLFGEKKNLGTSDQDGSVGKHGLPSHITTSKLQLIYKSTIIQNHQKLR